MYKTNISIQRVDFHIMTIKPHYSIYCETVIIHNILSYNLDKRRGRCHYLPGARIDLKELWFKICAGSRIAY